jgi:atrazine chlorohydrolase/5-methylthioadenosine/S-adenosylhomocysteine deaminase/melamine deaminase
MRSCSILISDAIVVTMNPERQVISSGFIAIDDDRIIAVGRQEDCEFERADTIISAKGKAVLPGFVNAHTHSDDLLLRGGVCDNRPLYDWLMNVVDPGCSAYTMNDVKIATDLYCAEAIRSGITTVVDSVEMPFSKWDEGAAEILASYKRAGMRVVYSQMFYDQMPESVRAYMAKFDQRPKYLPDIFEAMTPLDDALAGIEQLMRKYQGSDDGRVSVWPSPGVAILCSKDALLGAQELARRHAVMTTVHVCESPGDARQEGRSGTEHLAHVGYLAPDVLMAHCVQLDSKDVAILASTGAKVATNPVSNAYLGNGIAPITEMLAAGVTVGMGTDDTNANGNVNMISDLKFAALLHKARMRDAKAMTPERVLEMATINGAKAIGMESSIGSLEVGKKADLAILNLRLPHLVPRHSIASVLVYQANGTEVETVMIDGRIVLSEGRPRWMTPTEELSLVDDVQTASERILRSAELPKRDDDHWLSAVPL